MEGRMSVSVKLHVALPGLTREQATEELTSFVDKASETSRSQLQNLIEELMALQQTLENQGVRVREGITEFASLNQSALELTETITGRAPDGKELMPKRSWQRTRGKGPDEAFETLES
jgi:hypothetical protein